MKTLFLLLCLLSPSLKAESVPLPPSVSGVDDIINEFRNTLVIKINELGKNFISTLSDKTIVFKNSTPLSCNGTNIVQGEPVSSMQYSFKKSAAELIEKSVYTGCGYDISLVEDVITRGGKLEPLKYSDFIKGKREFDLKDDESYRLYRVSNSENEEIFKMFIEKSGNSKVVEFFILGEKFLRMNYDFQADSTKLTLTYYGHSARYIRKHASWKFNNSFNPFSHEVVVKKGSINQISYRDMYGNSLSQSDYLAYFNNLILSGAIARIRSIVDYHNHYFPTTEIVQSGSVNQQFKEELRIAFNRLQNNIELNLVKKQIQDYMDAAEKGLIIDNRPEQ